jgi:enoyl-[acyl-carrier protein] reductase I
MKTQLLGKQPGELTRREPNWFLPIRLLLCDLAILKILLLAAMPSSFLPMQPALRIWKTLFHRVWNILVENSISYSIGMSPNVRKGRTYDDLDYEWFLKTLDISALSFHKVLQVAWKMDAIKPWGSVVALSYIAAQRTLYGYNDMADAKALLESIARSFGYIYGRERRVRINTISQSPTATTAGSGVMGFDGLMDFTDRMSPLGNADAEECANYCIMLFSDLSRKITMQNLYNDGGFSSMGMSNRAMAVYNKNLDECRDCK